jgi:2'-5' RNA ligase
MSSPGLRLFVAINLPADVRSAVWEATAPMRACAPDLSWVAESRLHLTLKFLGEQPDERVSVVAAELERVADQHRELGMELGGIGAFPNFRRARVVWMGVAQEPRLELLHHDVEMAFEQIGFELEGRAFRPHLTLARAKAVLPEASMRELRRVAARATFRREISVRTIDLMQSDLSTAGPSYTTLVSAALRSE